MPPERWCVRATDYYSQRHRTPGGQVVKVCLHAPLNEMTGYGNAGLGLALAGLERGWDIHLLPDTITPPIPTVLARRLTQPADPPYDLFLSFTEPGRLKGENAASMKARMRIGWTMVESTSLEGLSQERKQSLRWNMPYMDLMVLYDEVTQEAYERARASDHPDFEKYPNLGPWPESMVASGGYRAQDFPASPRNFDLDATPFRFCMVGALTPRKGPWYAIEAFSELKEAGELERAELHLKTVSPGLHPAIEEQHPGVKVHYNMWNPVELLRFYRGCHVLLAPSLGEGKNMPAMEFMSSGGTVIATNWGGHTSWMASSYAYPLNYTLEDVVRNDGSMGKHAKPDKAHLKELMLQTYNDLGETARKCALAGRTIPLMEDWHVRLDSFFNKLEKFSESGALIKMLDQMAQRDSQRREA